MKRYRLRRPALALAVMAIVVVAVAPSASALDVGPLTVDISVNQTDWSACGTVSDDLTNANYTAVLTATGFESNVTQNGVILDQASATGNPASVCLPGGFDSSIAAVQYTLEWTSVVGTTGSLVKSCVESNLNTTGTISPEIAGPAGTALQALKAISARPVCTVS